MKFDSFTEMFCGLHPIISSVLVDEEFIIYGWNVPLKKYAFLYVSG